MGRLATTWQLMKDAWGVLMRDKVLVLFPIASSVACFLVLVTFVVPFVGASAAGLHGVLRGTGETVVDAVLFCYYVCNFFVVFYFNAALVDFVVTRLRGGEPTMNGSLRAATACLPQIAAWALISSTAGVILKALSSRAGFIGRIVISLVGFAWALVTYFVVPILVIERRGAIESIGESKDLLGKTWGQQILSGVAYGLIGFLLALPGVVVLVASLVGLAASHGSVAGVSVVVTFAAVVYCIALAVVMSTLRAIFGAVIYLYARTGSAPQGFSAPALRAAIQPG